MIAKRAGLCIGVLVAAAIWFLPIGGLSEEGKRCLALTLMTVIFWAFQVAQAGYVAGLYLMLLCVFEIAPPEVVLKPWTTTTIYLIIGAYLIASAVKASGLGERIAYFLILRFVKGYRSVILIIFALTLVLSLIIPHPWPRAFLIMSVISVVIKNAGIGREDAVKIGFSVFAASVPVSLVFLTGDSTINPLAVQYSGVNLGWGGWLAVMGVPALAASALTFLLILLLFRPKERLTLNREAIREKLRAAGPLTKREIRVLVWLGIAVLLWVTDVWHGVSIGWVTLLIAVVMAFPDIGGVLTDKSWGEVPIQVLLFISSAMAIGQVGAATGMNAWIAETLMPGSLAEHIIPLLLFVAVVSMLLHMLLGSVIAVMGVAVPALLSLTASSGVNPLVVTLTIYLAITVHYMLPFQHLNILVGLGEDNGMYTQRETLRLGVFLIPAVFAILLLVALPWWGVLGLT